MYFEQISFHSISLYFVWNIKSIVSIRTIEKGIIKEEEPKLPVV